MALGTQREFVYSPEDLFLLTNRSWRKGLIEGRDN